MHSIAKRLGFHPARGTVALFFIVAALIAAAFWIGPFRPRPAELRLLALSGDGRFSAYVGIPRSWVDTLPAASEAPARFPLILAVHNSGARAAQPTQLSLSVPARYRVAGKRGPLDARMMMGNPLAQYDLPIEPPRIQPGAAPTILASLDTIWLEPLVPSLYCTTLGDSVPEFTPAPAINADALSRVRIFYSFAGRAIRQRQTGLLDVQVDPRLIRRPATTSLPFFETTITKPEAPRPELGSLRYAGSRIARCGDPSQPVELHSVLWETPEGGRFFVLYHGGAPRKYLYDLNRDSVIELELWDSDGNGKFEARRAARITIPGFLMPLPLAKADSAAAALATDTMKLDSAWLRTFHDTLGGPLRFGAPRRTPRPAARPPATARSPQAVVPGRVDSVALQIFHGSEAGPLRFQRALEGDTIRVTPRPRPRPRDQGPRLLGTPYQGGNRR